MTIAEVREKYLGFFEARGHAILPSAPLVPENDPTTLFTGSGMQPLISYLLGQPHPKGKRLANSQKCFRTEDIEEVGDNRHTTFFEMLGNWSLGDYWKEEQLRWFFEFLTSERERGGLGIDPRRLYFTVFAGDEANGIPRDTESAEIIKKLLLQKGVRAKEVDMTTTPAPLLGKEGRIFYYGAEKNWWSRAGTPEKMPVGEPGGPDSEVFFEFVQIPHDSKFGPECHPNCDCGRFMEIGNSVFMEYRKASLRSDLKSGERSDLGEGSSFEQLPQRNVDFGGGLERITAAVNDEPDMFRIDALAGVHTIMSADAPEPRASRIIADHLRAAVLLIADGVVPSNIERGYFVRRLIRRASSVTADKRIREKEINAVVELFSKVYEGVYPVVAGQKQRIFELIVNELRQFEKTLERGLKQFQKLAAGNISGTEAFLLFSTYGFPIDMTVDLARREGVTVDTDGFAEEFKKHRAVSRSGADKKFKGGLADASEMSVKYHTATHLLHQALRDVLGSEVRQKGSNITPERLRFDFSFPRKMTDEEKQRVEEIVNEKIEANLPVHRVTLPLEEAKKSGALHFFDEKYPDEVLVHYIGDSLPTAYSKEFCGGPHVSNTKELNGHFRIDKEEAVSAGVRRIKASLHPR